MSFHDHFFGKIDSTREGELSLSLAQLLPYARATGPARTTAQVRRFLSRHSHLVLTDFHSAPAFPELLRNLVSEDISLVRLGLRQDLGDDPDQDKTLNCSLIFAEGTLEIRAYWTGWKELRAMELVQTLLRPLIAVGLSSRTFLVHDEHEVPLPTDTEAMFKTVMRYHGHPFIEGGHGEMKRFVAALNGSDPRSISRAQ